MGALFGDSHPNLAFVRAVLEGRIPGHVWATPSGRSPAACLVATGSPLCFVGGELTPAVLAQALRLLERRPAATLVLPPGARVDLEALPRRWVAGERVQYSQRDPADLERASAAVPPPYTLAPIDRDLYARTNWPEMVHAIFGSAEAYLAHAFGVAVRAGAELAAEAHGVVGGGLVELGMFAHDAHRGRGLATAAMAQAGRHGVARGLRVVVTFSADKAASEAVARAIGLHFDYRYVSLNLVH